MTKKIPKTKQKVLKQLTQPVTLTEEQNAVVKSILESTEKVQTLGGLAGSGKTTVVSVLRTSLQGYACCAYTGKAADVLRSKGIDASTIHSLIYEPVDDGPRTRSSVPTFIRKSAINAKGIIVDEASMVGRSIYNDLISFELPIIFVGDHGQLEPVGEGLSLMINPDYRLETVHRNAGDIAIFAHHLRSGLSAETFEATEKVKIVSKNKSNDDDLLSADQIICAKNNTRVGINRYIRRLKGEEGNRPVVGDRVISLKNSKEYGLFNGTQAIVRSVSARRMTVMLPNRTHVSLKFNEDTFNQEKPHLDAGVHPFDFAYAITCHKAQGSEWGTVLVLEEVCELWDHKRWAYTAASRAKDKLIWVTPN